MTMPIVLAVDDDPINLQIIAETFEDSGFDVRLAESGASALKLLESSTEHFDVVLLDRMMPEIDGLEVLARIRATERLASVPVILQTAAATPDEVTDGLQAGARYYLTKPYSPEALRIIVKAALDDSGRRQQLEELPAEHAAALALVRSASFEARTMDEVAQLSTLLATLCPEPDAAIFGLRELLVNAVEHGNLGITYAEKAQLRREDRWEAEVERRLSLPELRERLVRVAYARTERELEFRIQDEGQGFEWQPYLDFDPARACDPNGRGIAMAAAMSFSAIEYQGNGNTVLARIHLLGESPAD